MTTTPSSTSALVRVAEIYAAYYRGMIFGVWGHFPQRNERAEQSWETFLALAGLEPHSIKPRVRQAWERVFFEWNLDPSANAKS